MRMLSIILCSVLFVPVVALAVGSPASSEKSSINSTQYETSVREKARVAAKERRARAAERRLRRVRAVPAVAKGALTWGKASAPVTIVEFVDLECPSCKSAFYDNTYQDIKEAYIDTGIVRFAVRHYPLPQHEHARSAAEAVVCARKQGDDRARALYERVIRNEDVSIRGITADAALVRGLDVGALTACLADGDGADGVGSDIEWGDNLAIQATPTFLFIGPAGEERLVGYFEESPLFASYIELVR